jgi:type II secretory pathway component GspD/PulD (secretin)
VRIEEPPRDVRLIPIRQVDPATVAGHLEALIGDGGAVSPQRRPQRPGMPVVPSTSASTSVRILVHSEANALIVEAPSAAFERIERLVELLDVAPEKKEGEGTQERLPESPAPPSQPR